MGSITIKKILKGEKQNEKGFFIDPCIDDPFARIHFL
jgi:hypothetical protein